MHDLQMSIAHWHPVCTHYGYMLREESLHSLDARLKCGEVALDALEHLSLECALPPLKQQERGEPEHCAHAVEREEAQRGGTLLALNARRALCL